MSYHFILAICFVRCWTLVKCFPLSCFILSLCFIPNVWEIQVTHALKQLKQFYNTNARLTCLGVDWLCLVLQVNGRVQAAVPLSGQPMQCVGPAVQGDVNMNGVGEQVDILPPNCMVKERWKVVSLHMPKCVCVCVRRITVLTLYSLGDTFACHSDVHTLPTFTYSGVCEALWAFEVLAPCVQMWEDEETQYDFLTHMHTYVYLSPVVCWTVCCFGRLFMNTKLWCWHSLYSHRP